MLRILIKWRLAGKKGKMLSCATGAEIRLQRGLLTSIHQEVCPLGRNLMDARIPVASGELSDQGIPL